MRLPPPEYKMTTSKPSLENEASESEQIAEDGSTNIVHDGATHTVRIDQVIWGVWWIGTILIVLSWLSVVSNTVGWIGFAAALASTFVSVVVRKYWQVPR